MKRIDNVTRSPLFSHVTATANGLQTIHAYNKEHDFLAQSVLWSLLLFCRYVWVCFVFYSAPVRIWSIVINPSVCMPVRQLISGTTRPIVTKFVMQIPCGRGSILLWRRCDTLCTSGFMDDVTFGRNGPYGDASRYRRRSLVSMNALFRVGARFSDKICDRSQRRQGFRHSVGFTAGEALTGFYTYPLPFLLPSVLPIKPVVLCCKITENLCVE